MMRRIRSLVFAASIAAMPGVLQGATVIDDDFNDGFVGANTAGIGSGFTTAFSGTGSSITESGTLQTVLAVVPAGANIVGLSSNDTFNFFNSAGATMVWDIHHYAAPQPANLNSFRAFVGVGNTTNNLGGATPTLGSPFLTDEAYVWVQLKTNDTALGSGTQGALLVDKADGTAADVLATWNWAMFDGISPLSITMNLNQDGYNLGFSDGTPSVVGAWAGYFSPSDWSAPAHAIASVQSNTNGRVVFDRVRVSTNSVAENADFNGDHKVDGADFLVWQKGLGLTGQSTNANGDANGSTTVDGADLGVWKTQYGSTIAVAAAASVPEPATCTMLLVAISGLAVARRVRPTKRYRRMNAKSCLATCVLLVVLPQTAHAVTVIDDNFDDGDIAINANGVGTGFRTAYSGPGLPIISSGTLQAFLPRGANILGIASKDTFNFFNAAGATIVWDVSYYLEPQGSFRTFVGVGDGPNNLDASKASPYLTTDAFVWVQVKTVDNGLGAGTQGALLVDKAGGGAAVMLASWNWAAFDGFSPLRITMNLNQTGYDVAFTDGTPNATGSWGGFFSASDWIAGARAVASIQSADNGRAVFDRVRVSTNGAAAATPEPATWLLLCSAALFGLGVARQHARFTDFRARVPSQL